MTFTFSFIKILFLGIYPASPLLLFLCLFIVATGMVVARFEGWSKFDALYWSLITALTVGYGDIRPLRRRSKALAIVITLAGLMFSGIFVSITVHAALEAFERHGDREVIEKIKELV